MPSLTALPLSLSEILETRGGPLKELEIWALLCLCAEALQDIIIKGEVIADVFRHMITPSSLLLKNNGTIMLTEVAHNLHGSLYMAPELQANLKQPFSDTAFEKMFVYSLGRTLQVASEFGLKENEVLGISYDLDSLLQAMSERNASIRLSLMSILEACALQASSHSLKPPNTYTLSKLYRSVLGNQLKRFMDDESLSSSWSHQSLMSMQPGRARRPRPRVRHRHEHRRSWSRSRSRSRSRSPSRDRGDIDSGIVTASYQGSTSPQKLVAPLPGSNDTHGAPTATSSASQLLNTSMTSSSSNYSDLGTRYSQAAAYSVQGLLGQRQGSPAYQKYIQLKERQIRLRQARCGKQQSALSDVRSRLMTPTLMSCENMTDARSMASLMSYTLGTYKPDLHAQLGSQAALNYSKDTETDTGSQLSLLLNTGDYTGHLRAEEATVFAVPALQQPQVQPLVQPQVQHVEKKSQQQVKPPRKQPQQIQRQPSSEAPTKPPHTEPVKVREYSGPQFFHLSDRPPIKIALPLFGDGVKNAASARKVIVVHLTGQRLEVVLDPSIMGRQLFDAVIPYLDLDDFFFFGLTYICEGEHFFLDADTKLHKVSPEGWKEGPKSHSPPVTFTLYVRIKFYPESLTDFRHTISYHLLYLQLRKDILEERVTGNSDALFRLTGLALQAEYGDHSLMPTEGYFAVEHYFSYMNIKRYGAAYLYNNAVREHKNCKGVGSSQAEVEFIKHVRHLSEYGIHFHRLFKSKSHTDNFMWIGLSQHSLTLAEPEVQGRNIVQDYPWNSILKISFNKRRFSIQPKVETSKGKPPKINFYTNSYRKGRYLLQFSTDQHRFQIRMRTRPSNMETLADLSVEVSPETVDAGVGDDAVQEQDDGDIILPAYVDPSQQALPDDDDEDEEDWGGQSTQNNKPLQYRNPPPYQPPRMAQILGGPVVFPELGTLPLHVSTSDLTNTTFDEHQLQLLLDMSSRSLSLDSAVVSDRTDYDEVSPPYTTPQYFISGDPQTGRRIFEITLEKKGKLGIGITIVGGETTNSLDLGIFVKSVLPGGPAELDGRIMPGDRLIAIGGVSLEGKQHHEAVEMIRDGGDRITLLVSQIRPPGTIKKRNHQDEHVDFMRKLNSSLINSSSYRNSLGSIYNEDEYLGNITSDYLQSGNFPYKNGNNGDSDSYNSDKENQLLEHLTSDNTRRHKNLVGTTTHPNTFLSLADIGNPKRKPGSGQQDGQESYPEVNNNELDDDVLMKLREDQELQYELNRESVSWSPVGTPGASADFYHGQLTKEEEEALQILGDIAALDREDSSSDSDFESAVKKTVEGPLNKVVVGNKAVNTRNYSLMEDPAEKPLSEDEYEVTLEKINGTFGIEIERKYSTSHVKDGVYITKVLRGSSAEQQKVLSPGDRLLKIEGKNITGLQDAQAILDSALDVITVKLSRSENQGNQFYNQNILDGDLMAHPHQPPQVKNSYLKYHDHQVFKPISDDLTQQASNVQSSDSSAARERSNLKDTIKIRPVTMAGSESNTQSDVDSDVLDSSRSELETIYINAGRIMSQGPLDKSSPEGYRRSTPENLLDSDIIDFSDVTLKGDESSEFNEQLYVLRNALNERLHPTASPESFSQSSSNESVIRSPQKISEERRKSLLRLNKFEQVDGSSPTERGHSEDGGAVAELQSRRFDEGNSRSSIRQMAAMFEQPPPPSSPEVIEVSLHKEHEGFGFTVAGGANTGGCYVKQLISDPAISCGRVRPGDKIKKINGTDATVLSHVEAVTLLRKIPELVHLQLERPPSFRGRVSRGENLTNLKNVSIVSESAAPISDVTQRPVKELVKSLDTPKAVIKPYDYKASKDTSSNLPPEDPSEDTHENMLTIKLKRQGEAKASLGFSIVQRSHDGASGIYVKKLQVGGIAETDGHLCAGDQILQVNSTSLNGVEKSQAISIIREAGEEVTLTVLRSDKRKVHADGKNYTKEAVDTDEDISSLAEDALSLMERTKDEVIPSTTSKPVAAQGSKALEWYVSPRKVGMDVPVILSNEWLDELPLLCKSQNANDVYLIQLFQQLSDAVEGGEPSEEFKNLHQMKETSPCDVGRMASNKSKNRYRNVLPYDENRVKLLNMPNDYINASYISVGVGEQQLRYIACQGPVTDSVSDFWYMIWQEKINVIAMLTQVTEGGKAKCNCYWPSTKDEIVEVYNGALKVKQMRSYHLQEIFVLHMTIEETSTGYGREATLLQYTGWPDHGVPETALPLLKLLQVVHLFEQGSPPLVHCSAGIGRTGTFIAVDIALTSIEQGLQVNLYDIVSSLRKQRYGMIQTTDQYQFCYTACMEALLSLDCEDK
ncbi:tyrosine-protein phosphatase non-receptor type 13-like isoform X2 [Physella acuta]|uniref:tyrosine-protein phosphatase non-receptor type 13-like isoform X2 n=1 Tax=Physella acuta TaxID=109671 RepID=UPI0027DC369E|nr:tyrosine-protein phosphatase non-receptor type 13-like isoform X2 [Physella acuta]